MSDNFSCDYCQTQFEDKDIALELSLYQFRKSDEYDWWEQQSIYRTGTSVICVECMKEKNL